MASSLFNQVVSKIDQSRGTELEKKVKIATSPDNWNASSSLKTEIAQATYDYQGYREVMPMVWKRMNETNKNWAIVFKTLGLLEHLLRCGSERVIDEARERMFQLRSLQDFYYTSEDGKDRGHGIREMSRSLCELLNDKERLNEMRATATKNQDKYVGMSNAGNVVRPVGIAGGGGGSSYSSESYASSRYASYSSDRPPESSHSSYDPHPSSVASSAYARRSEVPTTRTPTEAPSTRGHGYGHSGSGAGRDDDNDDEPSSHAAPAKKTKKKIVVKVAAIGEVKAPAGRVVKISSSDDIAKNGAATAPTPPPAAAAVVAAQPSSTPLFDMFNVFDNPPATGIPAGSSTFNPSFDDDDDDDFNPRAPAAAVAASKPNGGVTGASAAMDDWAPFSSAPSVTHTSAPVATPVPVFAPAVSNRVEFDPFASSPPILPSTNVAPVVTPSVASTAASEDDWGNDGGFVSGAKTEAPKAAVAAAPKDLAWDSGLFSLNLKGDAAAKKQPIAAAGPSMNNLRGGNSLDGLGLPRAQGGPTPWIGGLPGSTPAGMGMGGMGGRPTSTAGFPGMMGGTNNMGMGGMPMNNGGMNMGMNMGMGGMPMGGNMGMGMPMNNGGMGMGMGMAPMGGMGYGNASSGASPFFPSASPAPSNAQNNNIFF